MRSSRLLATLLAIQRTGRHTAAALAEELEVSVRTVYRDIRALQDAGVPLWTEPGPTGGVRLMSGWRSPIDGMTGEEISALLFGPAGAADLGMAAVLATARSKVRSGLPPSAVTQLDTITERIHVDSSGWFREREPGPFLAVVASAVWDGVRLDIRYRSRVRRLDPVGLVLKAGVWYLVAFHRGNPRTYRVQRIESASRRNEAARTREGFVLADYWSTVAGSLDRGIRRLDTLLRVPAASLDHLQRHVPGPLTAEAVDAAETDGDHLVVTLPVENVEVATFQLATVPGIEVLEPPELRAALHALGARLSDSHC